MTCKCYSLSTTVEKHLILNQNISIKEIILLPSFCSLMLSFSFVIETCAYMYVLHKKRIALQFINPEAKSFML